MTDMLIRDVPEAVIAVLDANAARMGLSWSEYVRRRLAQDIDADGKTVTVEDLRQFAETFRDLRDPEIMARAWRR